MVGLPSQRLLVCPDDTIRKHLEQAFLTNRAMTEREIELVTHDGRVIVADCTLTPYQDARCRRGILVEIQQIDRHLRISREERLITQHKATWELLRGLAHEIKNPLGGIRGAAQLLGLDLEDASQREYIDVVISEADRLQALVDRILEPNRRSQKRRVNIHQVLERVRSLLVMECGDSVTLQRDYDPSIPALLAADPDQLIQAVLNIARNGIQAAGDGARLIFRTRVLRQFTLGTEHHRLVARIDVIDNGPGIPAEVQDSLFYPMVTSKAEGSGLGLTIAQSLVSHHGGLIEWKSRPGRTVFTIYLPLEEEPDGTA
jgi:two-component system nitrogen regulation sensor histidine kinase GlnL